MEKLIGVVLCGGESKRMGSDKGLMEKDGKRWATLVADKLGALNLPVVISINEQQSEQYGKIFRSEQLVVDNVDINGPLKGLLSVYSQYPSQDILLMACDLVDMDMDTLQHLANEYAKNTEFDFYAYQHEFAEPFAAIYTSAGLNPLLDKARSHSLVKYSFQTVLNEGKTYRIKIMNKDAFKNYNAIQGHHQNTLF